MMMVPSPSSSSGARFVHLNHFPPIDRSGVEAIIAIIIIVVDIDIGPETTPVLAAGRLNCPPPGG
ncbi:sugar ABC transporter ATP-binding protein [Anopheles sinensis]|uniref:Sugar ABC transporter ATP-binding protein n=1 Tax=Anopheles sinensis TaxID=74873 RepID=A0A084VE27_ANOSI|nr:sugar ABC transporter ATP-binding protein [Anopheles sinensis]